MAVATSFALARLRREALADCALAACVEQLCRDHAHAWRDRLLTPAVTVRLMLLQVLHGNTAINHLRQLAGVAFAAASYCEARARLPLRVWEELVRWVAHRATAEVGRACVGVRVLVADCSSFSMSDSPQLRRHFGRVKARGAKDGVSYPVAKLVGLLDAATGMFVQLLVAPLYTHDLRHVPDVHALLRPGDVLLGDRAYCSFAHFALLNRRGVFGCFRLHQRRKDHRNGVQRWTRGPKAPAWLGGEQWLQLPRALDVRIVSYDLSERGFRTQRVTIATTLLDAAAWPDGHHPRVIRRRMNEYDLMNKPREAYRTTGNAGENA